MHVCELFIWKSPCDMLLNTEHYISFWSCVVLSHLAVSSWIVDDENNNSNNNKSNQKTDSLFLFIKMRAAFFRFYFRCCVCTSFVVQILRRIGLMKTNKVIEHVPKAKAHHKWKHIITTREKNHTSQPANRKNEICAQMNRCETISQ